MKDLIVYEDNNILICNKPVGMASQSERSFDVDLVSKVLTYRTEKGEPVYAAIINRLDKPVGGLVLFAKDKRTAAGLSAVSGKHSIEKYYYAVVTGNPGEKGEYTDWLLKENKGNVSKVVKENTAGAKKAVLSYNTLESIVIEGVEYSLVKIRLLTGRHHQIRLQFSHHGHALYGDMKYNPEFAGKRGVSPALFAYHLAFDNPVGADRISVEVKPEGSVWNCEYFK